MEETRSRVRCTMPRWLWLVPFLVAIPLAFGATRLIENRLTSKTERALSAAEVDDVIVEYSGQNATLRGPASREADALSQANALNGVRNVRYVAEGDAAASDTSAADTTPPTEVVPETTPVISETSAASVETSAAPVAVGLDVRASITGKQVTLAGTVTSDAQKALLVSNATTAFGDGNVVDQLQVVPNGTPEQETRVANFAKLLTAAATTIDSGSGRVSDDELSITGAAFTPQGKAIVDKAAADAGGTANVTAPEQTNNPTEIQSRLADLLGRSGIKFETNSAQITSDSTVILDRAAESITADFAAFPGLRIEIGGHTDDRGDDAKNQTLSESRANAVKDYLVGKGVDGTRLTAAGYGETTPIGDNATESGRAANRRIEFTVSGS